MYNKSCMEFINILSSKAPVPGGGGASALVGAVGTALGAMVGNLTCKTICWSLLIKTL